MKDWGKGAAASLIAMRAAAAFMLIGAAGNAAAQDGEAVTDKAAPVQAEGNAQADATAQAESNAQAEVPPARTKPLALDEITVTAQKQEQSIRDVPFSVSAISGDTLRQTGTENLMDAARMTPNVQINPEQYRAHIRGFGSSNNQTVEQSVAFVIDGVYYGRSGYLRQAFVDLDRFEVLRGPQGTLFGKNAVAGVLNFTTASPAFEWGARLKAQMGTDDKQQLDVAITGPLWDDFAAMRLAGVYNEKDGAILNQFDGRQLGNLETRGLRGKLNARLGERFEATLSLSYFDTYSDGPAFQPFHLEDDAAIAYAAFDARVETQKDDRTTVDEPQFQDRTSYNGYALIEGRFGALTISSQTAYATADDAASYDGDGGPIPFVILRLDETYDQISQEFKITTDFDGPLNLIAGAFYFKSNLDGMNSVPILETRNGAVHVTDILTPAILQTIANPILSQASPGQFSPEQTDGLFVQDTETIALFAQGTWDFTDRLTFLAGVRLNWEDKTIDYQRTIEGAGIVLRAIGVTEFEYHGERSEFDVSPKASILYEWSDELSSYLTVARGYKAGGFSTSALNVEEIEFEPERADTIEIGLKGRVWSGRAQFNLGAFYMTFEDLQVSNYNGTGFVLTNAAAATSKGVEFDSTVLLLEGLILGGSIGYIDATYDFYPNGVCPATSPVEGSGAQEGSCDLSGKPLALAPEWTAALQISYAHPIGNLGFDGFVGWDASYQSDKFIDTDLDPLDLQAAHWMHNARVGLRHPDGVWQAMLSVRNVMDEIVTEHSQDVPIFTGSHYGWLGAFRQVNLSFELSF